MPFADADVARQWVDRFVAWYNAEHHHSAIRFVTPNQRHSGQEKAVLAKRTALYLRAQQAKPERWSRATRTWAPIGTVVLNPEPTVTADAA